jgi:hypothetical protein
MGCIGGQFGGKGGCAMGKRVSPIIFMGLGFGGRREEVNVMKDSESGTGLGV